MTRQTLDPWFRTITIVAIVAAWFTAIARSDADRADGAAFAHDHGRGIPGLTTRTQDPSTASVQGVATTEATRCP